MGAKNYRGKILSTFYPKLQSTFDVTALAYKTVSLVTTTAFRFQSEDGSVKYCLTVADVSSLTAGAAGNFTTTACMLADQSTFGVGVEYNFITFYNHNANDVTIYSERM